MIRVLEFADVINRFDFIDTIVQFTDPERFEMSVCVRSEEHNIEPPKFNVSTRYKVLPGNSRKDAIGTAWKLSRLLRDWKIDILHAHHFEQAVVGWMATRINRSTKLVIGRHYSDSIYRNPNRLKRGGLLALEQRINRDASRIIVPSRMIHEILTIKQKIDPAKVDIIYYGFVPEKFAVPTTEAIKAVREELGMDGRFVVANFGRYHEEKGQRYLIQAAKMLKEKYPHLLVLCVGEGPERERLENQITQAGLADIVILTGWRKDATTIMSAVDTVVQSTLQEAFSQVMVEALWMQKPLVMTDVSGAEDIIDSYIDGILIPKADASMIAESIERLIDDADLRYKLGKNGRSFVEENLTIDRQIKKFQDSFERAVS